MSKTLTVAGDITAVDTRTLITGQGSVTAPSLVVPSGSKVIDQIIVGVGAEGLAAGSCTFILRLGGGAVMNGEQVISIGAAGTILPQSGSDAAPQHPQLFILKDCQIDVSTSDTVTVAVEMAGTDIGTARAVVTLIFA